MVEPSSRETQFSASCSSSRPRGDDQHRVLAIDGWNFTRSWPRPLSPASMIFSSSATIGSGALL